MIHFKYFIILTILCNLISGCVSRLNKIYDFTPAKYSVSGGEIRAKLLGTFHIKKNETIKASPYELLITIQSNSKNNISARISHVKLVDSNNMIVFQKMEILEAKFDYDSDGEYNARFSFSGLDLDYNPYTLLIKCEIEGGTSTLKNPIQLDFKREYKEYRSNDFWDRIMSV